MNPTSREAKRHEAECHEIERRVAERQNVERAVLGSMALLQEAAEFAAGALRGDEFTMQGRAMFRAMVAMTERGIPIDGVTLADELCKRGELEAAGGALFIFEVLEAVPHAQHCRHYVEQLQALRQRDELRRISERLNVRADDPTVEPSETIAGILNELEALRAGSVRKSDLITAGDALQAMEERAEDPAGIVPTGLSELDRQLRGGIRGGQLIVIGGRPGLGKSALMAQMILNAARSHRAGLVCSLEMTAGEIAERGLKTFSRQRFEELPVWFTEAGEFSKLAALIRLAKRRHSIELAAVDYLQLMESPIGRNELRERQVATMSRGLKRLAMELQIPILLGSQLNRESEKRGRPSLADLRESGAIEQDADIVILISGDVETDERELIIAKHRGGACGVVKANFDRPKFWFDCEPWIGSL
jgi:replicative DNA helicase